MTRQNKKEIRFEELNIVLGGNAVGPVNETGPLNYPYKRNTGPLSYPYKQNTGPLNYPYKQNTGPISQNTGPIALGTCDPPC
jgi:hypothetical protein